jgi:hypothetical protein
MIVLICGRFDYVINASSAIIYEISSSTFV